MSLAQAEKIRVPTLRVYILLAQKKLKLFRQRVGPDYIAAKIEMQPTKHFCKKITFVIKVCGTFIETQNFGIKILMVQICEKKKKMMF